MENDFTIKDLYGVIDKRFTGLEEKIEKYHDSFIRFEEGKLTQALQDIERAKGQIALLQQNAIKNESIEEKISERRKDWVWGALEKIIFALVGAMLFMFGLVLAKLGILNLNILK